MVIFTKENTDADKPVPVVIIPPVRFIGFHKRKGIKGSMQEYWDPEISLAMITTVRIPLCAST